MLRRVILVLALIVALPLRAAALEAGVRGMYWFPTFSAEATVNGGGLKGTKVDLKDDLGMDDESYPAVEVFVGLGSHHLALSALRASYDGEKTVGSINFNGQTFTGRVESELDLTLADLTYQYDILDLENVLAGFSLGPVLQVKYLAGDVSIKETAGGSSEQKDFKVFFPTVGAGAHIGLLAGWLEARARLTGMGYGGNRFLDGLAEVVVTPFPLLDIGAGYRHVQLSVDTDDVDLDSSFSGPYATLALSW